MKDLSGVNVCVLNWHGSRWHCRWVCGGAFGMSGAFRRKLNLKNNREIFCNYVLVEFW